MNRSVSPVDMIEKKNMRVFSVLEHYCFLNLLHSELTQRRLKWRLLAPTVIDGILLKPLPSSLHAHQTSLKYVMIS